MSADPVRAKALAILREQRLTLLHVACRKLADVPDEAIGRVQSSREGGATYAIDMFDGAFTCTCKHGGDCAHALAVQLVVGAGAR